MLRRNLRDGEGLNAIRRGSASPGRVLTLTARLPRVVMHHAGRRWRVYRAGGDDLDLAFEQLLAKDKRLRFAFSGSEPLLEEFETEGRLQKLERSPSVSFDSVPGNVHIMRPLDAQLAARTILDRLLEEECERLLEAGGSAGEVAADAPDASVALRSSAR